MGQSHVDLVVVGLVDGEEMFCRFLLAEIELDIARHTGNLFYKRNEDETNEGVFDTALDNVRDLLNQRHSNQGDTGQRNGEGHNYFSQGELGLGQFFMAVVILVLVGLVNLVEQAVVRDGLVSKVDEVPNQRDDGHAARDQDSVVLNHTRFDFEVGVVDERFVKDSGKYQAHCG